MFFLLCLNMTVKFGFLSFLGDQKDQNWPNLSLLFSCIVRLFFIINYLIFVRSTKSSNFPTFPIRLSFGSFPGSQSSPQQSPLFSYHFDPL